MNRALVFVALAGCVSTGNNRGMGGLSMHYGSARVSDPSPDAPAGAPSSYGAHLCGMYRLYPSLAIGLGLDSTQLSGRGPEPADDEITYASYTGAITTRLDTGRFAISTTAGYYVGERVIDGDGIEDMEIAIRGPGVGAVIAARIGIGKSVAIEAGPFVRYFHLRSRDDIDTTSYDERGMKLGNLAFGVSVGIMLGGPPTSGVEDAF